MLDAYQRFDAANPNWKMHATTLIVSGTVAAISVATYSSNPVSFTVLAGGVLIGAAHSVADTLALDPQVANRLG